MCEQHALGPVSGNDSNLLDRDVPQAGVCQLRETQNLAFELVGVSVRIRFGRWFACVLFAPRQGMPAKRGSVDRKHDHLPIRQRRARRGTLGKQPNLVAEGGADEDFGVVVGEPEGSRDRGSIELAQWKGVIRGARWALARDSQREQRQ